jgi:hypothetical protein
MLISRIFPSGFDALLKHVNGVTRGYIHGQIVVDAPEILSIRYLRSEGENRHGVELSNLGKVVVVTF